MSRPSWPSWIVTTVYFFGMLLAFVGERIFGAGSPRACTAVGVLFIGVAIALRAARAARGEPERRSAERMLLGLYVLGLIAVALYLLQSDLSSSLFGGKPLDRDWPRLATSLAALWPALWLFAALPLLMAEVSYATVARAPRLELARVRDAVLSGIGMTGALVFAFAVSYVAAERDQKVDLSYFRTAKPGESTLKIVATMDQPITVSLFFPPSNEVREEVLGYFDTLKKQSKLLQVASYDKDVDIAKAKELNVSVNGTIVFQRDGHKEPLAIGLELEAARSQLRNLDRDVQTRLLKVARPVRTVYIVAGHGERLVDYGTGTEDKRPALRSLKELLSSQSYNVKPLSAAEGLAQDVPQDATVVIMVGPQSSLLPEETAALERYFDRGGRLLLAFEPDAAVDDSELLKHLGVKYLPTPLANDQTFARRTNQVSDRGNVLAATYSSHPSVTTLGRLGTRAPMIFVGTGSWEELKPKPAGLGLDTTVRAQPATWNDANGNFLYDPPVEQRKGWPLAMAVSKKGTDKDKKDEGRAILVGDADVVSDGIVDKAGNPGFVLDGMKWLIGEEAIMGEVSNENDIPIVHTKKEDSAWFYGSCFFMPLLVLGIGFAVTRRGGGKRVSKEKQS